MFTLKNVMGYSCAIVILINLISCQKEIQTPTGDSSLNPTILKSSSVFTVQNPGTNNNIEPNIQSAINLAKDGDTIRMPSGTFTFTGTITTTKRISLKGKGIGVTVLYRPESLTDASLNGISFFTFNINKDYASGIVISDFTIKSKIPSEVDMNGVQTKAGSNATDYGICIVNAVDFVVRRVRFENFGYAGLNIRHRDNLAQGLVYKCEFYHNFKYDGLGLGYGLAVYGENLSWVTSPNFGSKNFIFIENNTFEKHRHAICGGGNGLYVCRYNTFKNHYLDATIDMHEARGNYSNTYSTRATEIYNNVMSNDTYKDGVPVKDSAPWHAAGSSTGGNALSSLAIGIRGGESLIHDNTISYYKSAECLYAIYHAETNGPNTYPISTQIGYRSGLTYGTSGNGVDPLEGDGDTFIWNNKLKPYGPSATPYNIEFVNCNTTLLKEGRDYHFVAKQGYCPYPYPHPLTNTK